MCKNLFQVNLRTKYNLKKKIKDYEYSGLDS